MFFPQDDEGGRAAERVTTVCLQTWNSTQTTLPVLTTETMEVIKKKNEKHKNESGLWLPSDRPWSSAVPEDPVGRVLEQFGCEDVCERCYRSSTVSTPATQNPPHKKNTKQVWISRKSALFLPFTDQRTQTPTSFHFEHSSVHLSCRFRSNVVLFKETVNLWVIINHALSNSSSCSCWSCQTEKFSSEME